jgi:hypothetical protein
VPQKISNNIGLSSLHPERTDMESEKAKRGLLEVQENGCRLAKRWAEGDPCATAPLPLCTLVFEIVDRSNSNWHQANVVLHSPQAMESQSLRTLYDYVELCTLNSRSLVLFLRTNHPLLGPFKNDNPLRINHMFPAPMGILAHGVRILPPSASRQPFVNLPEELLRMIFREATMNQPNWRKTLISLALVCRAWSPALDTMYEDFGPYSAGSVPPNALQLAKTLEISPDIGRKIRVFDPSHFRRAIEESEATYLEQAKAIVTILQTATRITKLHVFDTHRMLAQDFVHALCSSSEVREFIVNRRGRTLLDPKYIYILSVDDILRCISHWPSVHKLTIFGFSSANNLDNLPTPASSLQSVLLQHGTLTLPGLRSLTTSWRSSLRVATLQHISGLTNEDLYSWLSEVGPTLTSLTIEFSPLSRRSDEEEYAVDVVMPAMNNLRHLNLEGDIVSELALLRYVPTELAPPEPLWRKWYRLSIDNAPGVNAHGFLSALRTTAWTTVSMRNLVLREENMELSEEAQRIAKERNILLMM